VKVQQVNLEMEKEKHHKVLKRKELSKEIDQEENRSLKLGLSKEKKKNPNKQETQYERSSAKTTKIKSQKTTCTSLSKSRRWVFRQGRRRFDCQLPLGGFH